MKTESNQPLVTLVVVPRESFDMSAEVVRQVYEVTPPIFKMIVMEGCAPEKVRNELRKLEHSKPNCKIIYSDRWLFPHYRKGEGHPVFSR